LVPIGAAGSTQHLTNNTYSVTRALYATTVPGKAIKNVGKSFAKRGAASCRADKPTDRNQCAFVALRIWTADATPPASKSSASVQAPVPAGASLWTMSNNEIEVVAAKAGQFGVMVERDAKSKAYFISLPLRLTTAEADT
jgi:hypothetical protein